MVVTKPLQPMQQADIQQILTNYDIGDLQSSKQLTSGQVQQCYFIKTSQGKFVVKLYANRSWDSVTFESEVIEFLIEQQFPCPGIILNQQSQAVSLFQNRPVMITQFVSGVHVQNPNWTQTQQLIEKVALMHRLTLGFQPKSTPARFNYTMKNIRELARQKAQDIGTENARKKLKWLEAELHLLQLPETLPLRPCHCDFHFSNVLFKDDIFVALIDFDDANFTYETYDLVSLINPFISKFEWNTWSEFQKDDEILDFKQSRLIVSEYGRHQTLTEPEKEHLFDVYLFSILVDCLWQFERGGADDFFEKRKIDTIRELGRRGLYQALFG